MPPHGLPVLGWTQNVPLVAAAHHGAATSFTYIAPTVKWNEAQRAAMSNTYKSGDAYSIGNQPYDSTELWMAQRTPATPRLVVNQQAYRGVQSSSSVYQAQVYLGQMLSNIKG